MNTTSMPDTAPGHSRNKPNGYMVGDFRFSVPTYERLMQLYAMGHSVDQITRILLDEFDDTEINVISSRSVGEIIANNKATFNEARRDLGIKCREELQQQLAVMYNLSEQVENKMVKVYVLQLNKCLDSMASLDIDEKDEDGNYVNTSRMFVLIEMCNKFQEKIGKVVGTDAMRELEIFRQKMEQKARIEAAAGNLLPPMRDAKGKETSNGTKWV